MIPAHSPEGADWGQGAARRVDELLRRLGDGARPGQEHALRLPRLDGDLGELLAAARVVLATPADVTMRLLEALDPREKHILTLRFFRGMTQSQIAAEIGISQMHVSRLLARTLVRLRDGLLVDDA